MTLPLFYNTVSTTNVYTFWDGTDVSSPSEICGRILLIGIYDISTFSHFDPVVCATTDNLELEYIGGYIIARSKTVRQLIVDGVSPSIGDKILLWKQTNACENGVYTVVKTGSSSDYFELKKEVNICGCETDTLCPIGDGGKTVYVVSGIINGTHTFQLMKYNCQGIGLTELHFIDLSAEAYYTNEEVGLRLIDSISSALVSNIGNDRYTINIPNFISNTSVRLLKVLVPWNITVEQVMKSLLSRNIKFDSTKGLIMCGKRKGLQAVDTDKKVIYHGALSRPVATETEVLLGEQTEMTKGPMTLTFNTPEGYLFVAYPASWGDLTKITDYSGYSLINSFNKQYITLTVGGTTMFYNCYVLNDVTMVEDFGITFEF